MLLRRGWILRLLIRLRRRTEGSRLRVLRLLRYIAGRSCLWRRRRRRLHWLRIACSKSSRSRQRSYRCRGGLWLRRWWGRCKRPRRVMLRRRHLLLPRSNGRRGRVCGRLRCTRLSGAIWAVRVGRRHFTTALRAGPGEHRPLPIYSFFKQSFAPLRRTLGRRAFQKVADVTAYGRLAIHNSARLVQY